MLNQNERLYVDVKRVSKDLNLKGLTESDYQWVATNIYDIIGDQIWSDVQIKKELKDYLSKIHKSDQKKKPN